MKQKTEDRMRLEERITLSELNRNVSTTINKVVFKEKPIVVTRYGKDAAVISPAKK